MTFEEKKCAAVLLNKHSSELAPAAQPGGALFALAETQRNNTGKPFMTTLERFSAENAPVVVVIIRADEKGADAARQIIRNFRGDPKEGVV